MSDEEFKDFVSSSTVWLTRLAVTLTGDAGAAEDLVQEVLARMYVRRSRVDEPRAYARRGLINLSSNRWRSISRRREVHLDGGMVWSSPDNASATVEHDSVIRAVRLLPPRQRAAIALRYLEDLSEVETAHLMGISVGSVKTHTARALSRLSSLLDDPDLSLDREATS